MRDIANTLRQKQKNDLTGYASPDILCLQLPTGVALWKDSISETML